MDKKSISYFAAFCLAIFTIGILLVGNNSPSRSKLITVCISGVDNQEVAKKVEKLVKTIKGIQTVFIDKKFNLFTFRYDSNKVDPNKFKSQMASLGLKISPVKSIKFFNINYKTKNSKLFSIRIDSASNNK